MSQINDLNTDVKNNSGREKQPKRQSDKRARSLRIFSVGSVAVLCAMLLVVNLLFDSLVGEKLTWDFTNTKINSIGSVSKGILSKMSKDVEIVGLFELTKDNESKYQYVVPVLQDYAKNSNGHITVKYVDPTKYPSIMTELDPNKTSNPAAGSFVVKCGDKVKVINYMDCFTFDPQYLAAGQYVPTSNNVEYTFTGAISTVTSDSQSKIYFSSNHSEASHVQLDTMLTNSGFEVADLSTVELAAIPDDCSLLIINNPQIDLSKTDIPLIASYMEKGGNLVVITDFTSSQLTYGNLNEVLHSMNLNMTNTRICENDQSFRMNATNGYLSYAISAGTFANLTNGSSLVLSSARGLATFDNPKSYIKTEAMVTTSGSAVLENNGDPTNVGVPGTQNAAMYSVSTGGKQTSELVVLGTTSFTSDDFISTYTIDNPNTQFFKQVIQKLIGETNTTQVKVKDFPNFTLKSNPSASVQTFWSLTLVAFVPLTFLIIGIVIYNRRKNK